ncbi:hypothetical protein YC2023_117274 [Brassica napus]
MSKKINKRDREDLLITSSCHLSLTLKKFQRLNLWHEVSDTSLSEIPASSLSRMSRNCFPKIFQDSEHIMYLNTSPHVKLESQIDIKCSVFHRHENMIWISNTHSFHGDKDRMINVSKVI